MARILYPCDFAQFRDGNLFHVPNHAHKCPGPLGSTPIIIFAYDHFQYSLFGLNILPMRFRAILRWQPLSRDHSRTLISRGCSFSNFHARSLATFVIWLKYATRVISCDSETTTSFACPFTQANIPAPPESAPFIIFARNHF